MPNVSLLVCLHNQYDLLKRLLHETSTLYDDLVVVHDGPEKDNGTAPISFNTPAPKIARDYSLPSPDVPFPPPYRELPLAPRSGSLHELVMQYGGRYFEGPRCFQQEPHWPFSWWRAKHDWILRLDADEFPSDELKAWLRHFRNLPEPNDISGYTCIWPLWDGTEAVTKRWPAGRIFLFHRRRVRFFGMVEQVPIPDTKYQNLELILHHQPKRESYGVRNILFRRQAYNWRRVIAKSLMRAPTDLPRWRWSSNDWPHLWNRIRRRPLMYGLESLIRLPIRQCKDMLAAHESPNISACLNPGLHHFMLGIQVFLEKQRFRKNK